MANTPKLDSGSGRLMEDNCMEAEKIISVLDHVNGLQYTAEKSESFVIDMDSISHGTTVDKDVSNPNSRLSFVKSLSRKGLFRGNEKKILNGPNDVAANDSNSASTFSPKGPSTHEKLAVGTNADVSSTAQVHHQITVTTTNMYAAATEGRCSIRRNSFKRQSSPWTLDPKKVLFLFATMSSIGSLLLIFFTLTIGKSNTEDITY